MSNCRTPRGKFARCSPGRRAKASYRDRYYALVDYGPYEEGMLLSDSSLEELREELEDDLAAGHGSLVAIFTVAKVIEGRLP